MLAKITLFACFLRPLLTRNAEWYNDKTFRLPKREPVRVGYKREVKLQLGETHEIETLSMVPPIFKVDHFFSEEECLYLIHLAKTTGLHTSPLHPIPSDFNSTKDVFNEWDTNHNGVLEAIEFTYIKGKGDLYLDEEDIAEMINKLGIDKNNDGVIDYQEFQVTSGEKIKRYFAELAKTNPRLRSRNSKQAWLFHYGAHDKLLEGFHERLARLTMLPHDLIEMSEPIQVVHYEQGGHYHCHHDSDDLDPSMPCCTYGSEHMNCRVCRYLTVMVFLTNVTRGGETAFPVADNQTTFSYENWVSEAIHKCNLAKGCHKSNLIIKPQMGTILMWYNHDVDPRTGWIGDLDPTTYHGGCDVIENDKWIANSWINVIGRKGSQESYMGWFKQKFEHHSDEL